MLTMRLRSSALRAVPAAAAAGVDGDAVKATATGEFS